MEQLTINHFAVIVCAIANLALGALWYSPMLFYKAWMIENNLTEEKLKSLNPAKTYSLTFVISLLMSYNMAFFLGDSKTDWLWGTTAGFLAGFGWVAMIFTIIGLFEMRSWKYISINSGFIIIYFTLIGFILGIWR